MRGGLASALVVFWLAGCGVRIDGGQTSPDGNQGNPDSGGGGDASMDAAPLGPWTMPKLVSGASSGAAEDDATLSTTTNEMIFAIADATNGGKDLWYMSRPSPMGVWTAPDRLPFNLTGPSEETPRLSPDGLKLYFASNRAGGPGNLDIYQVTRPAIGGAWGMPQLVPGVSTAGVDKWFMPCAQNNTYLTIVGNDIGEGTIGSMPSINTVLSHPTGVETGTFLSEDCLTVYFSSTPDNTIRRLFVSTRTSIGATWSTPQRIDDFVNLGTGGAQEDPWISRDQKTFVFVSDAVAGGMKDVYISTR